jgi:trehalose 6-phosphate synthase
MAQSKPSDLGTEQIIIASNRGPIEYYFKEDGSVDSRRSPGGLVTALLAFASSTQATWVSMAVTPADRQAYTHNLGGVGSPLYASLDGKHFRLRSVLVEEDVYRKYYNILSTELLWFTYNYLYDIIDVTQTRVTEQEALDAWTNGYRVANQAIADAVCAQIGQQQEQTIIMLQDNLLYLVSSMIRQHYPRVFIQQFLHWPWPDIRYLSFLPTPILEDLYRGLVGCDIIGLQTERDAHNFLDGANTFLAGATIDTSERTIEWNGHRTVIRNYPISISVSEERRIVQSIEARQEEEQFRYLLNKKLIMRVDRLDPIKNLIRGFQAYAQLFDDHPELLGQVHFLAFLLPTRENAALYQNYKNSVLRLIEEINQRYRNEDWTPIHPFIGNNRTRSLAAMQWYDVLLVNSIADGMNLVAKEGPAVNRRDGVLVLSRSTGAFQQLGRCSLPIAPTSIDETARALYYALTMPREERRTRATIARQIVEQQNLDLWIRQQQQDIQQLLFVRREKTM